MITENDQTKFVVKVRGVAVTLPMPSRNLAEAQLINLPMETRQFAEIVPVSPQGQEILFG